MKLTPGTVDIGGRTYKTLAFDDNKVRYTYMTENLDLDVGEGCGYYNNDSSNAAKYGRLYTWQAAQKTVIKGWVVIGWPRWTLLQNNFLAAELVEGGSSGMNFLYGGRQDANTKTFLDKDKLGYYWAANDVNPNQSMLYIFESPSEGGRFREWTWPTAERLSVRLCSYQSLLYPEQHS